MDENKAGLKENQTVGNLAQGEIETIPFSFERFLFNV